MGLFFCGKSAALASGANTVKAIAAESILRIRMPYSFSIIENFDPALVNYHMLWVNAGVNSLLLGFLCSFEKLPPKNPRRYKANTPYKENPHAQTQDRKST